MPRPLYDPNNPLALGPAVPPGFGAMLGPPITEWLRRHATPPAGKPAAPTTKPTTSTTPYAGYQTDAQQQASANAAADAGIAPQLALLQQLQQQTRDQGLVQGLMQSLASTAAAGMIKSGPSAGDQFAKQAGVSEGFTKGYQDTLQKLMPGQQGQDASTVLGALNGGTGDMFRTQGQQQANAQDNAVAGIAGRGQFGMLGSILQSNQQAGDMNAQALSIAAQRPGLYQTALDRSQTRQTTLAGQAATSRNRTLQALQTEAKNRSASTGVAWYVNDTGQLDVYRNDDGTPVLTPQGRVASTQEGLVGRQQPDVTLSKSAGQWVDRYGQPVAGWEKVPIPKADPKQPKINIDVSKSLGFYADSAGNPIPGLENTPPPQDASQPKVDMGVSKALGYYADGSGNRIPSLSGRRPPKPAGAKTKQRYTPLQVKGFTGTAARMARIAFEGGSDAKGNPINPMSYEEALAEFQQEGYFADAYLARLALKTLGQYYKPGDDRGTPMTPAQLKAKRLADKRAAAQAATEQTAAGLGGAGGSTTAPGSTWNAPTNPYAPGGFQTPDSPYKWGR